MTTHNIAITYAPKIELVRRGIIRQTIRPLGKKPKRVGDTINLFTWSGKPYRSPWAWRRRETIGTVIDALVRSDCIILSWPGSHNTAEFGWHSAYVEHLAQLDGIVPATGYELRNVLAAYHPGWIENAGMAAQIIRW